MFMNFKGKNVFLTGGSRGIGHTILRFFEQEGAIILAPSRTEMDLSNSESIAHYLKSHSDFTPDILILCAGLNQVNSIELLTEKELHDVFQINYFSTITLLKTFVPKMKNKSKGKIVILSSLYSLVSKEGRIPYASSKSALTGLMKTLALELAPYNIMVNAVAPGYVMTDMTVQNLSKGEREQIITNIPTGRFQEEIEIANGVMFLCSDLNLSITGHILVIDGGFLCR